MDLRQIHRELDAFMVPRSDEFECQGQRSKFKVTRDKTEKTAASFPLTMGDFIFPLKPSFKLMF